MRLNIPVTSREYAFPKGQTLVSTTDTQGRILYCNPTFIEVSGYTREELLGQPHNLIRHPDMPEEAFRDMWETIAAGKPWSAPVKNRRKDGDHYWVMANATPLLDEAGRAIGYMSVRTEASRSQIDAAEQLYAEMRREKASGKRTLVLKEGRLVKNTPLGRLREFSRLGLSAKIFVALVTMLLTGYVVSGFWPKDSLIWAGSGVVVDSLVLFVVWMFMVGWIVKPLRGIVGLTHRMAAGDLTQHIVGQGGDELGDLTRGLGQLNVNLLSIVRDAREQSQHMLAGATEIAQGNLDLSQRTESQASNLEETAASMEEITGTVRHTAESAQQAAHLSDKASDIAERGRHAVNELGETMKGIEQASLRIAEITQVIESIAFQTNILALNAAVEAARAGEEGRGFGVVAAEVRALAQRTSVAAKEIKQLIEDAGARVAQGQQKSATAQATMVDAVEGVRQVTVLVSEISAAANEQLSGISQINAAVAQLDSITQQNAALVEEMAASTQALEITATTVTDTVQVFRIDGAAASAPHDAVALRRDMRQQRQAPLRLGVASR